MRNDTEVFYDRFDLNDTRTRHSDSFVDVCHGFDSVFDFFV